MADSTPSPKFNAHEALNVALIETFMRKRAEAIDAIGNAARDLANSVSRTASADARKIEAEQSLEVIEKWFEGAGVVPADRDFGEQDVLLRQARHTMADADRKRASIAQPEVPEAPAAAPPSIGWAMDVLKAAMADEGYAWGWLCNLAGPIQDAIGSDYVSHAQANRAGAALLRHVFDHDITADPSYIQTQKQNDTQNPVTAGRIAAVKTLEGLGYTYHGAEQWRPPYGPKPVFDDEKVDLLERLHDLVMACQRASATQISTEVELLRRLRDWLVAIPEFDMLAALRKHVKTLNEAGLSEFGDAVDAILVREGGDPLGDPVELRVETKIYPDGTTVTGAAPLPERSPIEATAEDLRPLIEAPARRLTLTFTHPSIGDGVFATEVLKSIGEFAIYMAKCEIPDGDRWTPPAEPRYPFTASNGVIVDVLAWKTVDEQGGLPDSPFQTGESQIAQMTEAIRTAAQTSKFLHGFAGTTPIAFEPAVKRERGLPIDGAQNIPGHVTLRPFMGEKLIVSAKGIEVIDANGLESITSLYAATGKADQWTTRERAEMLVSIAEQTGLPLDNSGPEDLNKAIEDVQRERFDAAADAELQQVIETYDWDRFVQYGADVTGGPTHHGMAWSFMFHGHAVTHESDTRYIISGNNGGPSIIFDKGETLRVDEKGFIVLEGANPTETQREPDGNRGVSEPEATAEEEEAFRAIEQSGDAFVALVHPDQGEQLMRELSEQPIQIDMGAVTEQALESFAGHIGIIEPQGAIGVGRNEAFIGRFIEETLEERRERLTGQGVTLERILRTQAYLSSDGFLLDVQPTVGRRVWFRYRENGRATSVVSMGDQPMDAGIAYVHHNRLVNLSAFDHAGRAHTFCHVPLVQPADEIPTSGHWCEWMPFQVRGGK